MSGSVRYTLLQWLARLLSGKPHFIIGGEDQPYLKRWYLIPRNTFINVYLHQFLRSDDDRAKHDHPWWFVSFLIWGSYLEDLDRNGVQRWIGRSAPSVALRRTTDRHIVYLFKSRPAWTIVITGRTVREWGFWCPKGFIEWKEFYKTREGHPNGGCGE